MKTINEYMDDGVIIHESQATREIHAIRLKIHDETQGLTLSEYTALIHKSAKAFLAEPVKNELIGLTIEELADLAESPYTIEPETDLSNEEKAYIEEGRKQFKEHPETFVTLDSIK